MSESRDLDYVRIGSIARDAGGTVDVFQKVAAWFFLAATPFLALLVFLFSREWIPTAIFAAGGLVAGLVRLARANRFRAHRAILAEGVVTARHAHTSTQLDQSTSNTPTYFVDLDVRSARKLDARGLGDALPSANGRHTYEATRKVYESIAQGDDARWVVVGDRFLVGSDEWVSRNGPR